MATRKARVAVNGYGVIGKRVADAVALQDDMELVGVADVVYDYRIRVAVERGYPIYASVPEKQAAMEVAGLSVAGNLGDLLRQVDIVVDATPKGIGARNKDVYEAAGVKAIWQGGEKHELAGYSFVAQVNYAGALNRQFARVVSCNTTALSRVMHALHRHGWVKRARAVLLRRGTDPWESHKNGMINTVIPETRVPSHQGPDAQAVIPDLDITTMAGAGPYNLSHLHFAMVETPRPVGLDELRDALWDAPPIAFVRATDGLVALNAVIELMRDLDRSRADMWEVAVWEEALAADEREFYLTDIAPARIKTIPAPSIRPTRSPKKRAPMMSAKAGVRNVKVFKRFNSPRCSTANHSAKARAVPGSARVSKTTTKDGLHTTCTGASKICAASHKDTPPRTNCQPVAIRRSTCPARRLRSTLPTATPTAPSNTKPTPLGLLLAFSAPNPGSAARTIPANPKSSPTRRRGPSRSPRTMYASPAAMSGWLLARTVARPGLTIPPARNIPAKPRPVALKPTPSTPSHTPRSRGRGRCRAKAGTSRPAPATNERRAAKVRGGTAARPVAISGKHSAHRNVTRLRPARSPGNRRLWFPVRLLRSPCERGTGRTPRLPTPCRRPVSAALPVPGAGGVFSS
ncbi:MAG: type II glyceraldehyde-3-phosphate dehydrogenase [Ardenticatenaceae bacterium]|nr:type II glyceraldehyde-3-phosphate dehydrogenase [Ardenticatenaceae bacterium]